MNCGFTYEHLAAYLAGDLAEADQQELDAHRHDCAACGRRLAALAAVDQDLAALRPDLPRPHAVLETRRALTGALRNATTAPEIMSLDDVAAFLQLSAAELEAIVDDLPAFELAGRIRVRRQSLLDWVRDRERQFRDASAARWASETISELAREGRAS